MDPNRKIHIRPLCETDSFEELTDLLHLAYKSLADQGFRYLATHQTVEKTKERSHKGECFVALFEQKIIATVTYIPKNKTNGNEWYAQPFVSTYGQFAVHPEFQKQGLGGQLVDLVEKLAIQENAQELTVDTAEGAKHLIDFYSKRGYRFVGYTQWNITNYRSMMLSKKLFD